MPKQKKTKKEKEIVYFLCQYCNKSFKTKGARTNHEKHCKLNQSIQQSKSTKSQEEELKKVQELKTIPNLPPEQKQNLNLMEGKLINETEDSKIKKLKDEDIQLIQQTNREKRAQIQDQQLTQQLSQFQQQDPNSLSIKDLLELRKIEALGNKDNSSNLSVQNQLTMQKDLFDFKLGIVQDMQKLKENNNNSFEEFNRFQEMAEKFASRMGYTKDVGKEGSAWDYIAGTLSENIPKLIDLGQKKMEIDHSQQAQYSYPQPEQPEQPQQGQPQTQPQTQPQVEKPGFVHTPSGEGVIDDPPRSNIPSYKPSGEGPNPISPPRQPSDRELMQDPSLHNQSTPNIEYSQSDLLDQHLNLGKFSYKEMATK